MRGGEAGLGPVLPVLLRAAGGERGEAGHEEVEAGEGNHVDRQLPQVSVQLAGEPEAGGHAWAHIVIVSLSLLGLQVGITRTDLTLLATPDG